MAPRFAWRLGILFPAWISCALLLTSPCGSLQVLREEISLLAADKDPKCFTRADKDLTCFWEGRNNTSYDFYYEYEGEEEEKKCTLTHQRVDPDTGLHICLFPPEDVYLFVEAHIKVTESGTNKPVYERVVNVENQVLLEPPTDVSVSLNGKPQQLTVRWTAPRPGNLQYEIQYSSDKAQAEVSEPQSRVHTLYGLSPGEKYNIAVRAKPDGSSRDGFWSAWSQTASAVVPRPADEIHLNCFTPDLQYVICNWNSEEMEKDTQYTLYYQSRNGDWEVCDHSDVTNTCTFQGWNSSDIIVTVNASSRHQNHTFYKEPISMNHMVLTAPPKHLAGEVNDGKLRLQWEPALAELADHMVYQIRYSLDNHSGWKHIILESPEPRALLDVQVGSQYHIQIKTKPNGDTYRGSWSNWSHTFTVAVPSQLGLLLIGLVPLVLIVIAVVIMATFSKFFSKIKQHLWPPVPDLDRVLENFLTEINKHCQPMQPFNDKLCEEDVLPTVVEIVSEKETSNSMKSHGDDLDSPSPALGHDRLSLSEEKLPLETTSQGYVVLDPEHDVKGSEGNEYVHKEEGEMDISRPVSLCCQSCCFPDSSVHGGHVLPQLLSRYGHLAARSLHQHPPHSADISNHSYLLLADSESKILVEWQLSGEANLYANGDSLTQLVQSE
ncbi:thrombopoietin receptor-like [Acipenser oxyrinchus oxyrinchus]|uniref:Thrombopoietin receptor-like n=1 Tax=Acipenser oxyrinchus oxyrinchus TaxID=40147 RepID=A0AAD8D8U7_ACIOX|nr:thrombopoietin receptor-like [Acipenser oxyrinchus oxyrinchus]